MTPLVSRRCRSLAGDVSVPGDKSISHRALMIGALAVGETPVKGLLESADVMCTAAAMRALGASVSKEADGSWRVLGRGVGGLVEPSSAMDMGNSGTSARLLMGVLATHPFTSRLAGDASLSARPMERVMAPLRLMGASFEAASGGCLPLCVKGTECPLPIEYRLPMASAQVKSAVLLAGLNTPGATRVIEPSPTRDHSELMLSHFGARVDVENLDGGARAVTIHGQPEISGRPVVVPGDISSAAFPLVAALLVEGSRLTLQGVGVNPLRTGLVQTLNEMGAVIVLENRRTEAGEPVADLRVEAGPLRGVQVPAGRVPSMIDEFPILAVAAACAEGATRMSGLGELRVKESDRLGAMARGLEACGVKVEEGDDTLTIHGTGKPPRGGAGIKVGMDHRIAMSFLVLGMVSEDAVSIDDASSMETSFPGFSETMNGLGAHIGEKS